MRFRSRALCLTAVATAAAGGPALADPAPDAAGPPAEYGVGVRLRNVRGPAGLMELFVESAPGGSSDVGFGAELVRRRGTVEIQLGLEYEHIQPAEGVWIQRDTDVAAGDEADYIVGPGNNGGKQLSWFTIEFTFLNHAKISKHVAIRYGGGAGVGVVLGELARYNVICVGATNASPTPGCVPVAFGGTAVLSPDHPDPNKPQAYDLPPVFPVVNAIIGVQISPQPKFTVNIEGGIRTFPFFGVSADYFF